MAKINNGPLVGSISGRLGPVVFAQTRFGQVVHSVQRTVVHHSIPALQTKQNFRYAAATWSRIHPGLGHMFDALGASCGRDGGGIWRGAVLRYLHSGVFPSTPSFGSTLRPQIASIETRLDGKWRVHFSEDAGQGQLAILFFGSDYATNPNRYASAIEIGAMSSTWSTAPMNPPFDVFAFGPFVVKDPQFPPAAMSAIAHLHRAI